jgi:hypothetical protein
MKLISTEFGQSFQEYRIEEIRPFSGIYTPALIGAVRERYAFAEIPTLTEAAQQGAKFKEGRFVSGEKIVAIQELGIYKDGIVVVAWNTDDSDAVLDDLVTWTRQSIQIREPIFWPTRLYASTLLVEFDYPLDRAFGVFAEFNRSVGAALKGAYGWEYPLETTRIAFGTDPTQMPPHRRAEFTVERRVGVPFSENRHFSSAPLRTPVHLELLASFERFVGTFRDQGAAAL